MMAGHRTTTNTFEGQWAFPKVQQDFKKMCSLLYIKSPLQIDI